MKAHSFERSVKELVCVCVCVWSETQTWTQTELWRIEWVCECIRDVHDLYSI